MDRALRGHLGPAAPSESPFDRIRFDGNTDRAIVRAALVACGIRVTAEAIDAVLARYLDALDEEIAERSPFRALAGAHELAVALSSYGLVGLGTGNIEVAAQKKVAAVGMQGLFAFGGYGSDAEARHELLEVGARRGAALAGVRRETCRVVVIGDTGRDIEAAHSIGARAIAVASGNVSSVELRDHGADVVLESLLDIAMAVSLAREA